MTRGERIVAAVVAGLQEAAVWVEEEMKTLVSVACEGEHSKPGEPPKRESGDGVGSIVSGNMENGAYVGVKSLGTNNMIGSNYMAGWDSPDGIRGKENRRPWLSRVLTENRYKEEIDKFVRRHLNDVGVR